MHNNNKEFVQSDDMPIIYVDAFRIGFDAYKFVVDFGSTSPSEQTLNLSVRVILSQNNFKALSKVSIGVVEDFESYYAPIREKAY